MITGGYLDILDELLAGGAQRLSASFIERQLAFVLDQQQSDGGFRGRMGGSDPYYSDFAMRLLTLLEPSNEAIQRTASYWAETAPPPHDVITCFNRLNAARMLEKQGIQLPSLPGIAVIGEETHGSYITFLTLLSMQMLGQEVPSTEQIAADISTLQCADGGFCDSGRAVVPDRQGQTNATAAAIAVLTMCNSLDEQTAHRAAAFLAGMQAPDGGLRAHDGAPESDLLSTFTGSLTLSALDSLERINLGKLARFVKLSASPAGGFRASPSDDTPDIEYTYYGVCTLALLYAHLDLKISWD